MATDNNINEFENGNENELNEYSGAANREELSNHMKEKSAKNREAQLRISRKQKNKKFIKSNTVRIYKTGQTADNAKYEIGETGSYSGNNRINTHTVKISDYNSHLIKKIETDSVTQQIRSELQDILRAADFEGKPVSAIVEGIYSHLSKITASDDSSDRANANMHKMAAKFFKESYEAIDKANLTPKNRVIAAQSIADLMIKNYSPIAFIEKDDNLDQYTDKYVVRDTPLLKEQLENLNVQNVDKLINDINAALENGFEYDQYEIKENAINSGSESVNTHALNMPSYNNFWIKHVENDSVTQSVRSDLNNILKAAGIKENDASALADDIHGPLSQTVAFDNSIDRQNINMHDIAAKFFKYSYVAIDKANLSPSNRIIAAQKIADLMIKNYSPVAFVKGDELGQYTDKYVAQNKALLKDQLEMLNVQNVDNLINEVDVALANGFEYDRSKPEGASNTEPKAEEVDPSKPRIPDFYKKLGERMDSADITGQVKSEIAYIIIDAGITDTKRVAELSDASYSFVKGKINSIYDKETVPETKMSKDAPTFFRNAYESLNGYDLSTQAQIIAAQKIANVMLKNYSPVAFIEEGLEHYANDYVLNNRDVFKSQLDMLMIHDAEALMDDVDAARGDNEDTEFTKWLNDRIDSPAVFGSVYNEMSEILKNAGFTDQHELAELVRFTQDYGSRIIMDSPHLDGDNPNMHDIAVQFFEESYQMIAGAELSPKDRIITAQKIADVLLKNYSPVATEKEFAQYANNYVLGNATLLSEQLKKLEVEDIDALIADRDIAKVVGPEKRIPDMINGARLRENPKDYMLDRPRNGKAITNICSILVDAGITEDAAQNLEVGDILENAYSNKNISAASVSMRDVAKHVFVSTYEELTKKELAPNNKIETAQKIADVILKNYSPIIRNKALDKYANNYVINDSDLLRESLTELNILKDDPKDIVADNEEKKVENTGQKVQKDVDNVNEEQKQETKQQEAKPISDESRVAVYTEKLKTYNNMYKLDIDSNNFVSSVTEAWNLMTSGDKEKMTQGQKVMNDIFKDTLKKAFDVEKGVAYDEHRLPEYAEIIKSTNELLRSAMYGFTDMYHNPNRTELFDATAFGGVNAKDIADLTTGDSFWSKDQKSDEAWDIQSGEAKKIADKWLKEDKPYEKMINELNALVKDKNNNLDLQEAYNKLTAAEWLLINDEKMMIEDPQDPYNPIPNWGNRYWKTLTATREALGIPKHTSMRDLIQLDYAESAKAVENRSYNERQIYDGVLDPADRAMHDSLDVQKEQFATLSAAVTLTKPSSVINSPEEMKEIRVNYPVEELNQRKIMENEPKVYNFILEQKQEINLTIQGQGQAK